MGMLWKLFKIVIALALAVPLSIIVLATALGVLGALMGLAILTLKLAVVGSWCGACSGLGALLLRGSSRPAGETRSDDCLR